MLIALAGADVDVHHHRLRAAGDHGVAVRHADGGVLVRHHHRARHRAVGAGGAGEGLDDRGEIGAGVDEQVVDAVRRQRVQVVLGGDACPRFAIHFGCSVFAGTRPQEIHHRCRPAAQVFPPAPRGRASGVRPASRGRRSPFSSRPLAGSADIAGPCTISTSAAPRSTSPRRRWPRRRRDMRLHHRLRPAIEPDRDVAPGAEPGRLHGAGADVWRRVDRLRQMDRLGDLRRRLHLAAARQQHDRAHEVRPVGGDAAGDAIAEGVADQHHRAAAERLDHGGDVGGEIVQRQALQRTGAAAAAARIGLHHAIAGRRPARPRTDRDRSAGRPSPGSSTQHRPLARGRARAAAPGRR